MFSARCVPNMYHFCTFSAQNTTENRATVSALLGQPAVGITTPRFRRYDAPPRAGWRNTATRPPATPLRARAAPRKGILAELAPEHFCTDLVWE
jgi:hypothetical protein